MLTLLALALPLQSQVWIVDDSGGPGVDFTDLPPAIAAASGGDVLLIRSGVYSEVLLNRGLTLQADEGAVVNVAGLRIESVPAGDHVVVAGLTVPSFAWISGCGAKVWIEDCRFEPPDGTSAGHVQPAITVLDCADVVLVDTVAIGRDPYPLASAFDAPPATPGLRTTNSSVHVFECSFEGGDGEWLEGTVFSTIWVEMDPAAGAEHESGELVALASSFVGGNGHWSIDPYGTCVDGSGAAGVSALAPIHVRDCQLVGGAGGFGGVFVTCPVGLDGPPWSGVPPVELAGEYVTLDIPSPIRENGTFDLTLSGSPGVVAVVGIGVSQEAILVTPWGGSLAIQGPYIILPPIAIPDSGTVTETLPLLDLGPSVESLTFFGQVAALDPVGAFTVNDASVTVLLDDQF